MNAGVCPKCNQSNAYTLSFCTFCGDRLPWADALRTAPPVHNPAPVTVSPVTVSQDAPEEDSTGTLIGFGIGSALLPCAGIIVGTISLVKFRTRRGIVCLSTAFASMIITGTIFSMIAKEDAAKNPPRSGTPPISQQTIDFGNRVAVEQEILGEYNKMLAQKGAGVTCTAMSLASQGPNKYSGYANLNDGSQMKIDVALDSNNQILWFASPPGG